jgi:hypothetical protein
MHEYVAELSKNKRNFGRKKSNGAVESCDTECHKITGGIKTMTIKNKVKNAILDIDMCPLLWGHYNKTGEEIVDTDIAQQMETK